MGKKILIVGGVAGGASAATRLRRLDEDAQIILFERDDHISFANCGLPYYIGGEIKQGDKLLVQTPESMRRRFNIDVRVKSEVTAIDTENNRISIHSGLSGDYEESYDYLILSPGAKALKPDIPGIGSGKIFVLRNIEDTDSIKAMVIGEDSKNAVVIGGGYVGVEVAENLIKAGLRVSLAEAAPHILAPFDSDMSAIVEKEMEQNGINLILNDGVKSFRESEEGMEVILGSGKRVPADMVILAMGVVPDTAFIKNSKIETGPRGHIVVNKNMQTNIENVYAVGDAVEVRDFITGNSIAIALAGPANKQGRIAADNIAGMPSSYNGTQGSSIIKVFNLAAAATGKNERELKKLKIDHKKIIIHPVSHASYYPGSQPMTLKLLFNDSGKILGAQCIGAQGVDKRIDVIATVIRLNGTVYDLKELELTYAPPFSSAKDPVNMAGYVAGNLLEGNSHLIDWEDLKGFKKDNYILLDVRSLEEYDNGHVEGAVNIPLDSLRERFGELDRDKTVVVYCQVALRGYIADRILTGKGYRAFNISGGYRTKSISDPDTGGPGGFGQGAEVIVDGDTQIIRAADSQAGNYDK